MAGEKILIVDDEESMVQFLSILLSSLRPARLFFGGATFAVPSPSALLVARLKLLSVGSSPLPNAVIYAMSKTMDSNERSNL